MKSSIYKTSKYLFQEAILENNEYSEISESKSLEIIENINDLDLYKFINENIEEILYYFISSLFSDEEDVCIDIVKEDKSIKINLKKIMEEDREVYNPASDFFNNHSADDFLKIRNALISDDEEGAGKIMRKYLHNQRELVANVDTLFFFYELDLIEIKSQKNIQYYEERIKSMLSEFESSQDEDKLLMF